MKAIRSLEQHVDSLMSYDFTQLTDEELRMSWQSWTTAESEDCRSNPPWYAAVHASWHYPDRHLVHWQAGNPCWNGKCPQDQKTYQRAKTYGVPGLSLPALQAKQKKRSKIRADYGIKAAYKMVDTCAAEFAAATPLLFCIWWWSGTENEVLPSPIEQEKDPGTWLRARSVLDRVLSLTSLCTLYLGFL